MIRRNPSNVAPSGAAPSDDLGGTPGRRLDRRRFLRVVLAVWAAANLLFIVSLWFNHALYPFHLDLMEGTILQHLKKAASLQPVYPAPTPEYVAFAYNPLYYYLTVPFSRVFGETVFSLRLVAILGMAGAGLAVFIAARRRMRSAWWGLIAAGLFAAAYRAMDANLDSAHADSWFLCAALWGTLILDIDRSRSANLGGILLLVVSFWFKQHGALFAIGGLLFIACRHGIRKSIVHALGVLLAGPVIYIWLGPQLFGSHFHYFTWEVPRQWSTLNTHTFLHFGKTIVRNYLFLALSSCLFVLAEIWRERRRCNVWTIQSVLAVASGFMGALDDGSADNVYIAMGTWFILVGLAGFHSLSRQVHSAGHWRWDRMAIGLSFLLLLYDPRSVLVSPKAQAAYGDFLSYVNTLPGTVYAPHIGQLETGYAFRPAAHWAALEDMVRGPGRIVRNHPGTRRLLESCLRPAGKAYLLTNHPLPWYPIIDFLEESYVLDTDLGDRFEPLRYLPKRWDHGYPRYLYRFEGRQEATMP